MVSRNVNQIAICQNKKCSIRNTCARGKTKRDTFQRYVWAKPDENGICQKFLPKTAGGA